MAFLFLVPDDPLYFICLICMSACRVIVALTARRTNVKRTDMSKASAGFPTEQHVMAQPHGGLCTVLFFYSYCIFCQVAKLWQNFLLISLLPVYTYLRVQHVVRTNYLLWLFHRTFILASPHVHSCPVALFSCVCVRVFFIRIVRANRWYVCVCSVQAVGRYTAVRSMSGTPLSVLDPKGSPTIDSSYARCALRVHSA